MRWDGNGNLVPIHPEAKIDVNGVSYHGAQEMYIVRPGDPAGEPLRVLYGGQNIFKQGKSVAIVEINGQRIPVYDVEGYLGFKWEDIQVSQRLQTLELAEGVNSMSIDIFEGPNHLSLFNRGGEFSEPELISRMTSQHQGYLTLTTAYQSLRDQLDTIALSKGLPVGTYDEVALRMRSIPLDSTDISGDFLTAHGIDLSTYPNEVQELIGSNMDDLMVELTANANWKFNMLAFNKDVSMRVGAMSWASAVNDLLPGELRVVYQNWIIQMMTDTPGLGPRIMYDTRNVVGSARASINYIFSPIADVLHINGGAFEGLDSSQTIEQLYEHLALMSSDPGVTKRYNYINIGSVTEHPLKLRRIINDMFNNDRKLRHADMYAMGIHSTIRNRIARQAKKGNVNDGEAFLQLSPYFSARNNNIPSGNTIDWYVKKDIKQSERPDIINALIGNDGLWRSNKKPTQSVLERINSAHEVHKSSDMYANMIGLNREITMDPDQASLTPLKDRGAMAGFGLNPNTDFVSAKPTLNGASLADSQIGSTHSFAFYEYITIRKQNPNIPAEEFNPGDYEEVVDNIREFSFNYNGYSYTGNDILEAMVFGQSSERKIFDDAGYLVDTIPPISKEKIVLYLDGEGCEIALSNFARNLANDIANQFENKLSPMHNMFPSGDASNTAHMEGKGSIFLPSGVWNPDELMELKPRIGTGNFFMNSFRSELHNLEAFYTRHSRNGIATFVNGKPVLDGAKSRTVNEVLGTQLMDVLSEDEYKKFMSMYGEMSYYDLWGDVAFDIVPGENFEVYRLRDLDGVGYPKTINGITYQSLQDYYVANFAFPIDRIKSHLRIFDNSDHYELIAEQMFGTPNPERFDVIFFSSYFEKRSHIVDEIDTPYTTPSHRMGLVGNTRTENYQLDAFMTEELDKTITDLIEKFRSWDRINLLQKTAYMWALGIRARNDFLKLAAQTIFDKLSWVDKLLSKIPF